MKIHIVLFQPEIPQNTGNIARTCSATGSVLHLIHPLGFSLDEKHLRRAGLDYWDGLEIYQYENDEQFFEAHEASKASMFFLSQKGGHSLWETDFTFKNSTFKNSTFKNCAYNQAEKDGVWLCFGRESRGLDEELLRANLDNCVRIPMIEGRRSLNLSNAVAVTVYEVLRQFGGFGLKEHGMLEQEGKTNA